VVFAKKVVAFSVFILVWFALAEVIGLSCARMGVQAAIGMWADWLYVAIQLCIVSLSIVAAYLVWRRIQAWHMAKVVTAACVVGLAALVIIGHTHLWVMFGKSDSDERIVPSWEFNIQTPEAQVPRDATDIHVVAWRGISPATRVTFRVEPSEAQAYLERVKAALHITQGDLKNPELQRLPSEVFPDSWGKARDDQPWWYRKDNGTNIFIQVDVPAGRVYLDHSMP
jgi:hypothetical protein